MKSVVLVLALVLGAGAHNAASAKSSSPAKPAVSQAMAEAKRLFERYVGMELAFDSAVAGLYADDAVIQNRRKYPDGQVRSMTLPAPKYKELIRAAMPAAKARNDKNAYSDVRYASEGSGIRITAKRFSELKKYTSPLSLLVKPDTKGVWLIYEELSESQP
jgi:hypothetical protein